jgi:undecaprenyl diphosphate synthase
MKKLFIVPQHLAIIVDGNGRWAKSKGLMRLSGHAKGLENLIDLCKYVETLDIKILSLYCFSTENWKRPEEEVKGIFKLALDNAQKYKDQKTDTIKIKVVGFKDKFDQELLKLIDEVEQKTKDNTKLTINICADYGSRGEIIQSMIKSKSLEEFNNNLWIKEDVDFLIRTGNEKRLSNFLLWQASYAELYFSEKLFPDFNREDLNSALDVFQRRKRRFGAI